MPSYMWPSPTFPVLTDLQPTNACLTPFLVSTERGFLPRVDPPASLPPQFSQLSTILSKMPILTSSGQPGLLASQSLAKTIDSGELPDLTREVDGVKDDLVLVNALYRDYSFLASGYLLEGCHARWQANKAHEHPDSDASRVYGLARDVLPAEIARPMVKCAEILKFKPFMEYAGSYALYNYRLQDPERGMRYDNLRLIRAFEHGLDASSSEAGFVLVHVEMAKHSGLLVKGTIKALSACSARDDMDPSLCLSTAQRLEFNQGLAQMLDALCRINDAMETMWARSKPSSYNSFRTFIFGITAQSMFPRGVLYEGVFDSPALPAPASLLGPDVENLDHLSSDHDRQRGTRLQFRGESGANDSIVPLCDNFLQIQMPQTPLTEILTDFRKYRPSNHREFLEWVRDTSHRLAIRELALDLSAGSDPTHVKGLAESRELWMLLLNKVREFRFRHWCFAREYIIKKTAHPTATGGSPIVTWLPNQLEAVLRDMSGTYYAVGGDKGGLGGQIRDIMELVERQKDTLRKEVKKYCAERGVVS